MTSQEETELGGSLHGGEQAEKTETLMRQRIRSLVNWARDLVEVV
jgi:hypothetical protein